MTKHTMRKLWIFSILVALIGCDLPHEPGPMPGEIISTEFEAGLNILGVLRADSIAGSSLFHIGRALTTQELYTEDIQYVVENAVVRIVDRMSGAEYIFSHAEDSIEYGIYRDSSFMAICGHGYDLEITAPGFPVLTATTLIPAKPELIPNSLEIAKTTVRLQLLPDPGAQEIRIYVICDSEVIEQRLTGLNGLIQHAELVIPDNAGQVERIVISALDTFLASYSNSGITFIPNTYHADGSTVTNGYGCFGSLAVVEIELDRILKEAGRGK